jgi:antitoxin VapB
VQSHHQLQIEGGADHLLPDENVGSLLSGTAESKGECVHVCPDWNGYYRWYAPSRAFMDTARLFQSGRSQAVRLPKDYRFRGSEVAVKHFGNGVLLLPIDDPWQTLEDGLAAFEPGFVIERDQPDQQQREPIQP